MCLKRVSLGIASSAGIALLSCAHSAYAQSIAAPYDESLNRLAEVLGSVHYLTNLCGEPSNQWRDQMQQMLSVETPEPNRRALLVASFNRGYRSFDSVYTTCTLQARQANARYIDEGITISTQINARYGE